MNKLTHQFTFQDLHIVLDIASGSIHVVDELSYSIIEYLENKHIYKSEEIQNSSLTQEIASTCSDRLSTEEAQEILHEISELVQSGQLFTTDEYESYIEDVKQRKTVVKALCLHIAHDCNLACRYCFAEEGEYHGKRGLMSLETGKKAIDFLIQHSGNRRNLEVDFFGGEPLMNWQVVKDIVKYGRVQEQVYNKNFRFTLTTNGVLLSDDVIEYANQEMDNVVLSLDGRKEVNDHMRPFRGGAGSFDLVVPKYKKLVESRNGEKYYIRGTFTRDNLDFCADLEAFLELGFDQLSIEPVVGDESNAYAIREEDLPMIFEEYDKAAKLMLDREKEGKPFTFFHFLLDLEGGPCVAKRLSGCGAGTEYLAVTPWGELFPCHQFVGQDEFLLGHVDTGIEKEEIVSDFRSCNVYTKEACKTCFARFYCSGGCMANSQQFHGSIHDIYEIGCEMERKRVECAIGLQVTRALAE